MKRNLRTNMYHKNPNHTNQCEARNLCTLAQAVKTGRLRIVKTKATAIQE